MSTRKPPRKLDITVAGIDFPNMAVAARALGIPKSTFKDRINALRKTKRS